MQLSKNILSFTHTIPFMKFMRFYFIFRLVMQPFIENSTSHGHVAIDMEKDANVNDWPPIVLDINNITITKAEGQFRLLL